MIDANEKDLADHVEALKRFGGVQPKGNGKSVSIGMREPSLIAEGSMNVKSLNAKGRHAAKTLH